LLINKNHITSGSTRRLSGHGFLGFLNCFRYSQINSLSNISGCGLTATSLYAIKEILNFIKGRKNEI